MDTLPGETSPPKSGCRRRVPPLLMKAMKFAELASTGACEMSVFHQLSAGNSGSGPGTVLFAAGTTAGHWAKVACAANANVSDKKNRAQERLIEHLCEVRGGDAMTTRSRATPVPSPAETVSIGAAPGHSGRRLGHYAI